MLDDFVFDGCSSGSYSRVRVDPGPYPAPLPQPLPEPLAPLDPLESTLHLTEPSPVGLHIAPLSVSTTAIRHSGWAATRRRVYTAIETVTGRGGRLSRFANCGRKVWVMQSDEDSTRFRVALSYCHDRFCTPCANARSARIRERLGELLPDQTLRFLTLTLGGPDLPLSDQLDRLLTSFQRLRRRKLWRERVEGGIAFLEVKRSSRSDRWHPHLHVLLIGNYFPLGDLKALWLDVTGDSYVVDIRIVKSRQAAISYVAKYATKAIDHKLTHDAGHLPTAVQALAGRKTLYQFGICHRWVLLPPEPTEGWHHWGTLDDLQGYHSLDPRLAAALTAHIRSFLTSDVGPDVVIDLPPEALLPP